MKLTKDEKATLKVAAGIIQRGIKEDGKITIRDFGKFSVSVGTFSDPRTGAKSPSVRVNFKPAPAMKALAREGAL